MKAARPGVTAGLLLCLLLCLPACGAGDPHERILKERARWKVTLVGWAQAEDDSLALNLRVSGPVRSRLDRLTVRFLLLDAEDIPLGEEWYTLDLSHVDRGGPRDFLVRLPPAPEAVEGIGIDLVVAPAPHELPRIEELQP